MRIKLVRDKIPDIIAQYGGHVSGEPVRFETIRGSTQKALEEKLQEEMAEFLLDPSTEELADIMEVIDALKKFYPEVDQVKATKKLQKGGFDEGWLMLPERKSV